MDNPSILSHVSLGTNQLERGAAFYDAVLATLGCRRIEAFPGAVAWGKVYPEFWLQQPLDGQPAAVANGVHVALLAPDQAAVDAFHAAALAEGGLCAGAPGLRPDYAPDYYAAFVRDLDGHKIEAHTIPGGAG